MEIHTHTHTKFWDKHSQPRPSLEKVTPSWLNWWTFNKNEEERHLQSQWEETSFHVQTHDKRKYSGVLFRKPMFPYQHLKEPAWEREQSGPLRPCLWHLSHLSVFLPVVSLFSFFICSTSFLLLPKNGHSQLLFLFMAAFILNVVIAGRPTHLRGCSCLQESEFGGCFTSAPFGLLDKALEM